MRRETKRRLPLEWPWVALVGLVILLGIWWFPGVSGTPRDTFGASWGGKKAYFLLARELFGAVDRETEFLESALYSAETLVVLGPARDPTPGEWAALDRWVREGGNLLFAGCHGKSTRLSPFDLQVGAGAAGSGESTDAALIIEDGGGIITEDGAGGTADGGATGSPDSSGKSTAASWDDVMGQLIVFTEKVKTPLARGEFRRPAGVGLDGVRRRDEVLVEADGRAQAIRRSVGHGTLVVCSSDVVFSNSEIANEELGQALLAVRLLEACVGSSTSWIVFDESLNATGTPKAFGILFDPTIRHISLQILLCIVLFAWSGYRRFGPPLPPARGSRRSVREHAVALGNLHYKAGAARHAVGHYLEFFLRETGMRLRGAPLRESSAEEERRRIARLVARAADLDEDEVAGVLDGASRAVSRSRLSASEAARRIAALAEIRRRIEDRGKGGGR